MKADPEQLIWGINRKKGVFKKTVVNTMTITNYRACLDSTCIDLDKLDDIIVMNQRTVSESTYSSIGGIARVGSGKSTFRMVGDVAFIYQGRPYIVFRQIEDPQGVTRLATSARKRLIEKIDAAEKMKKAQLQQKQQLKERISTTTPTTCPRCSSTNSQSSKYCNNCGFRFADGAKEEEGTITKDQIPSSYVASKATTLTSPSSLDQETKKVHDNIVIDNDNFVTCESPVLGIRIKYPSNWAEIQQGLKPPLVIGFRSPREHSADSFSESVGIALHTVPNNARPEQLMQANINALKKKHDDLSLVESVTTTLAGQAAYRVVYDTKGKRFMENTITTKNKAYQIVYVAEQSKYDSYLSIVQKMLDSFEII